MRVRPSSSPTPADRSRRRATSNAIPASTIPAPGGASRAASAWPTRSVRRGSERDLAIAPLTPPPPPAPPRFPLRAEPRVRHRRGPPVASGAARNAISRSLRSPRLLLHHPSSPPASSPPPPPPTSSPTTPPSPSTPASSSTSTRSSTPPPSTTPPSLHPSSPSTTPPRPPPPRPPPPPSPSTTPPPLRSSAHPPPSPMLRTQLHQRCWFC